MRGLDHQAGSLFSHVSADALVPADHPLRVIPDPANAAPARPPPEFDRLQRGAGGT